MGLMLLGRSGSDGGAGWLFANALKNELGLNHQISPLYLVFRQGSVTYAKNGLTGNIDFNDPDPTVVIQSTLNAASNSGGQIYIKEGSYTLTTALNIYKNTLLQGSDNTVLVNAQFNIVGGSVPANFTENITVQNLTLSGPITKTQNAFSFTGFCRNIIIRNIRFTNYNMCIYCPPQIARAIANSYNNPVYNISVEHCYSNSCNATCIIAGLSDCKVSDFLAEITYGVNPSLLFSQVYNAVPTDPTATHNAVTSFYLNDLGHTTVERVKIYTPSAQGGDLFTFDSCISTNVKQCVASGGNNGCTTVGSSSVYFNSMQTYFSNNNGYYITTNDYDTFDIVISGAGFTLDGVNQHGIYVVPSGITAILGIRIADITITNAGLSNPNTYDGVNFEGSNLKVIGCFIGNEFHLPTTMRYAVNTNTVGTNYVEIIGNDFVNLTTSPAVTNAAPVAIIKNNIGYKTENNVLSGTFAIDAAVAVAVTIPHGLDITPAVQDCSLTAVQNTVTNWAGQIIITSTDATNVYVTVYVTAPGAAGATAKLALRVGNP